MGAPDDPLRMVPVGHVRSARTTQEDDRWLSVRASIVLDARRFGPEALRGLDAFSHLEVVYGFHLVGAQEIEHGARHPRERGDWPAVGIFAQRGKARPNRLGVSRCRLLALDGLTLEVEGLDAIDGSPVLDIKPWIEELGPRGETHQPPWTRELMRDYF